MNDDGAVLTELIGLVKGPNGLLKRVGFLERLEWSTGELEMTLSASTSVGATAITVKKRPGNLAAYAGWVVVDPYTSECEVRLATAISGNTFTVGALAYAHAAGDPVLWIVEPIVEVRWFGAKGDNSTNDKTAIQRAVTQTIGVAGRLHIPQGTYAVTMGSGETLANCTTAIEVYGDGVDRTVIAFGPNNPSIPYKGLSANATSGLCVFRDLTLQGPATLGSGEVQAIQSPGTDNEVLIERVRVTQNWKDALQFSNANRLVTMRDCDIHGGLQCMTFSTASGKKNRLHVYNTRFRGMESTSNQDHIMYLNPGLNYIFYGCRFETIPSGGGYVFHNFGSDTTVPDYCIISNCVFESGLDGSGAILSNPNGETQILGCTFDGLAGHAIATVNDAVIEGCRFTNTTGILINGGYCRISGCQVLGTAIEGINVKVNGSVCVAMNCVFEDTMLLIDNGVTTGRLAVSNCQFIGNGVTAGLRNYDGLLDADNCNFYGTFGTAALYNGDDSASTGYCNLTNCSFYNTSGDAINYRGLTNSLFAENCFFASQDVKRAGSVMHNVKHRKGLNPSTVASAGTITLSANYDVFHITGTTTINTIQPGKNDANCIPMHNGTRVFLIADGAWALGNAGNIVAAGGARTVNDVVELVYDAGGNVWYEVGP